MTTYFGNHNISETFKAEPGMDTRVIDVPFVPDYIKVEFHGPIKTPKNELMGDDGIYWNLISVTPTSYQLAIGWSTYYERDIYFRISRLTVDPV